MEEESQELSSSAEYEDHEQTIEITTESSCVNPILQANPNSASEFLQNKIRVETNDIEYVSQWEASESPSQTGHEMTPSNHENRQLPKPPIQVQNHETSSQHQQQHIHNDKNEIQKLENEKAENEKVENEKVGNEKVENEKVENEKVGNEKVGNEKVENEKVENEKVENEKVENEKVENEKVGNEKVENEKAGNDVGGLHNPKKNIVDTNVIKDEDSGSNLGLLIGIGAVVAGAALAGFLIYKRSTRASRR